MEAFVGSRGGSVPITRILVLSNFPFYEKLNASLKFWLQKSFLDLPSFEISHLDYRVIFPLRNPENPDPQEPLDSLNNLVKVVGEKKVQAIFWEKLSLEELDLVYNALKTSDEAPMVIGASQELYETVLNPIKLKIFAQSAGLNLFPWSGMACRVDPETDLIRDTEYGEAFVQDADSGLIFAEKYKFPILLNSSAGSGECTSEIIYSASRLVVAFTRFRSAGPNSVFLSKDEKDYQQIDLIVFSDQTGKVDYLPGFRWEAECGNSFLWGELSQSPNQIDVQKMEISCKALVKSLKYSGVATVSFWFRPNDRTIYFKDFFPGVQQFYLALEDWMGFSLPAIQLQIAMGISLDSIDNLLTQPRSFSTLLTKEVENKYLWETSPKKVAPIKGYHFVVDAPVSLFLKTLGKSTDMPKSIEELSIVSLEKGQYLFLRPASVLLTASGKSPEERSLRMQKLLKRMLRWDDFGKMLKKLQTFDQSHSTTSPVGEAIALLPQETHNATIIYPASSSQNEDNSDRELQAALLTLKEKLSGKFLDANKATENFQSILKNQSSFLTRIERIQNDISLLKALQDTEQSLAQISDLMTRQFTQQFDNAITTFKGHLKSHVFDSNERSARLLKELQDTSDKFLQSSKNSTIQSSESLEIIGSEVLSLKKQLVLLKEEIAIKIDSIEAMIDQKFDMFQKSQETLIEKYFSKLTTRLDNLEINTSSNAREEFPTYHKILSLNQKKYDSLDKTSVDSEITSHLNGHYQNEIATNRSISSETALLTKNNAESNASLQLSFSPKDDIVSFLWAFEYSLPLDISPRKKVSALLQSIGQESLYLVYRNFQTTPIISYQDLSDFLIKEYTQPDMQD